MTTKIITEEPSSSNEIKETELNPIKEIKETVEE